jgi:hypothetical protein
MLSLGYLLVVRVKNGTEPMLSVCNTILCIMGNVGHCEDNLCLTTPRKNRLRKVILCRDVSSQSEIFNPVFSLLV